VYAPANTIYGKLVADPNDFVGAVAYSLYKQTKVAWLIKLTERNGGVGPTPEESTAFYDLQMLDISLQAFRDRAKILAESLLNIALQDAINEVQTEARESALGQKFELIQRSTNAELELLRSATESLAVS
jgi:hypothetical protein